ncbi:hypothetical protein M2R47_00830 [Moraxella sp. Tifton1]|uniref:Lipoprotein n=1 Tax=Moraxella oculi TaxID=2940516 RepID=A0ABW8U3Y3_9GAMM|nr:hypothetical protein [Moraxella sp. Tifton1]MCL1622800.1 hypothetical protein [Moraxella sp. Tifton1]
MKKLPFFAILLAVGLSSCATQTNQTNGSMSSIRTTIIKSAIDTRCRSELNANPVYEAVSVLMSSEQKSVLENKTCGCVSDKAAQNMTLTEIGQATIDPDARKKLVNRAVKQTFKACANELLKSI